MSLSSTSPARCFDKSEMAWFRSRASKSRMAHERFLGLYKRTIGDLDLAIPHPERDCITGGIDVLGKCQPRRFFFFLAARNRFSSSRRASSIACGET